MATVAALVQESDPARRCFAGLSQAQPFRVTLRFTIPPSGRVEHAGIEEPDWHGSALERCLADAVREIPFPPTSGRGSDIHYPLLYQPGR